MIYFVIILAFLTAAFRTSRTIALKARIWHFLILGGAGICAAGAAYKHLGFEANLWGGITLFLIAVDAYVYWKYRDTNRPENIQGNDGNY